MSQYTAQIKLNPGNAWKYSVWIQRSDGVAVSQLNCAFLWTARIAYWRRRRIAKKLNKLGKLT